MKKIVVTVAASVALLVSARVASAAGPPGGFKTVSCTLANGYTTQSWSFRLPGIAVSYFQMALARIQQAYPALTCTIS